MHRFNHNPLPDIPHEEFDSLLGPLLVPEHYPSPESPLASSPLSLPPPSPIISVPSDWIHFEGRSAKTTSLLMIWSTLEQLIPHADVVFLN
ncbi:hypothetical protein F5888DRAFT_1745736 [Russula emetica]|nr:hypothetical protein F5888DRAFT_1745736 [Russula emetica]